MKGLGPESWREMVGGSAGAAFQFNYRRAAGAFAVVLLIAAAHILRIGSYLTGEYFNLYYSYFSDVVLPVAIYFLLCISDITLPFLRDRRIKAALVFLAASSAEIAQGFGVPLLGSTFDPLDFVMYGAGALLAVGLDALFARLFSGWTTAMSAVRGSAAGPDGVIPKDRSLDGLPE